jgi:hypothetical protein
VRLFRLAFAATSVVALIPCLAGAAYAETATATLTAGGVSMTTSTFAFGSSVLSGTDTSISVAATSAWTALNARGTDAGWTVTISSTDLVSAHGTVDLSDRTILANKVSMTMGAVSAVGGSDATGNISSATVNAMSSTPATFLTATGTSKGSYSFTPTLAIAVPASAYRSNWPGVVGTGSPNPYTATLTVTMN